MALDGEVRAWMDAIGTLIFGNFASKFCFNEIVMDYWKLM